MAYVIKREKRFTGYYRHAGKRLSAGTWDTETEAMYNAIQAERSGLQKPSKANLTLSNYVDQWLSTADLMPITKKGYRSILDRYVLPRIGDLEVTRIDRRAIQELLQALKSEQVGSATIGQIKASLGSAFSKLVQAGDLTSNPTQGIKIKIKQADLSNVLEPDDFKEIIKHLPTEGAQLFARFLVASGLRYGEATEIRIKDINFKTGELFVQRRVSDLGAKYNNGVRFAVIEATKSGYKRSLMISKALLQDIQAYVIAKALAKDDLLFSRTSVVPKAMVDPKFRGTKSLRPFAKDGKLFQHGTLYSYTHGSCRCEWCRKAVRDHRQAKAIAEAQPKQAKQKPYQKPKQEPKQVSFIDQTSHLPRNMWRTIWNKAIAQSAIGWLPRTHDLRHANATQLLKNGVDVHEVKERLGHQSIKTTERYLHRLRSHQSKASEGANDFLE
jgi:integrase